LNGGDHQGERAKNRAARSWWTTLMENPIAPPRRAIV
jgi:hypothetical protein